MNLGTNYRNDRPDPVAMPYRVATSAPPEAALSAPSAAMTSGQANREPGFAEGMASSTAPRVGSLARTPLPANAALPNSPPGPQSAAAQGKPTASDLMRELLDLNGDRCLATVGPEVILLSEVLPEVEKILAPYKDQAPPEVLAEQRVKVLQKILDGMIDIKLLLVDLKGKVPKENLPKLREQFVESFNEKEIPDLMKKYKAQSRAEIDRAMRAEGSSLAQHQQQFMERAMAITWARQQITDDKEVTHQQMVDYYREHAADYEFPAKAKWEQITVEFGASRSKEEAWRRLAMLGNMVLDGAPFAEVAKQHSDGATASEGGRRDWTTKGSLISEILDQALFELPVGQLSPIIQDRGSFHIIRVLERQAAGRVEFLEAQTEIRKKLQAVDRQEQIREFIGKVRKQVKVWTLFDDLEQQAQSEQAASIY